MFLITHECGVHLHIVVHDISHMRVVLCHNTTSPFSFYIQLLVSNWILKCCTVHSHEHFISKYVLYQFCKVNCKVNKTHDVYENAPSEVRRFACFEGFGKPVWMVWFNSSFDFWFILTRTFIYDKCIFWISEFNIAEFREPET